MSVPCYACTMSTMSTLCQLCLYYFSHLQEMKRRLYADYVDSACLVVPSVSGLASVFLTFGSVKN